MTNAVKIRPRERDAILQSLRAGVVPRIGQQHIQVGRKPEVEALMRDLDRIRDGGAAIRFVIGEYGAGKTFFLHLIRSLALQQGMVTIHADLNPDRRIHATGGQARALFAELMRNASVRTKPDGGALSSIVERFVTAARTEAREASRSVDDVIHDRLRVMHDLVGGYDFAHVIEAYWRGVEGGGDDLQRDAVRWLRAEFSTKTDARQALGVRAIIDDHNFWDQIKLFGTFVKLAGYEGLLVCLDEMVNVYKLSSSRARASNYEQVLRILNDSLQGTAEGIGVVFGGTPEFLSDTRRGLYSYEALRSRLSVNAFAVNGMVDTSGPVLRLANLSREDMFVVLKRIVEVVDSAHPNRATIIDDDGIHHFMRLCEQRIGSSYFQTPRTTITQFADLLAILEQNPSSSLADHLREVEIVPDPMTVSVTTPTAVGDEPDGMDELATLRLT
jgi:hypothetical protein